MDILQYYDLSQLNTFGLVSSAKAFVSYQHRDQLSALSALLRDYDSHWVLGGGSNVILAPQVKGLTIKTDSQGIRLIKETADHWLIEAEAGENWHNFVAYTLEQGWCGLENLAYIPGTVGAAPVQNIGAYGVELDQRLHSVLAWHLPDATLHEFTAAECGFAYRDSRFKQAAAGTWLIVAVRFLLAKQWQPVLAYPDLQAHPLLSQSPTAVDVFKAVVDIRQRKLPDPIHIGNAGSFFKNPIVSASLVQRLRSRYPELKAYPQADDQFKLAAAWLIDKAGWKARPIGQVAMHANQALVMTNLGQAKAGDVKALAKAIQADIFNRFGVALEQEPINVE